MMAIKFHKPVLLEEVLNLMNDNMEVIVDATCGNGGHSYKIAYTHKDTIKRLYCFDKDPTSLQIAKERLLEFDFVRCINKSYVEVGSVLKKNKKRADFILFDLGLSMWQITSSQRGFSFKSDEILDMRYNPENGLPVYLILQRINPIDLAKVFKAYGDVKGARKLANVIVRERKRTKIKTTFDLVGILKTQYLSEKEIQKVFMSLRIYVNNELQELITGITRALNVLNNNGIIAFITYHSIEDRIVKRISNIQGMVKIKPYPIKPKEDEIKQNKSARSAKLRAFIKGGDYVEETPYTLFNTMARDFPSPFFSA